MEEKREAGIGTVNDFEWICQELKSLAEDPKHSLNKELRLTHNLMGMMTVLVKENYDMKPFTLIMEQNLEDDALDMCKLAFGGFDLPWADERIIYTEAV